jgi:LuxR family maltose regulon positive regulatory protein
LTARERQVLKLLTADCTYQQIGDEMVISINTVRTHVRHIYEKLSVKKRVQAVAAAQRLGLLNDYEKLTVTRTLQKPI